MHIAPGHGADDYQAGKEHGLEILSPVDDMGLYTEECGLPDFVGKHVFKSNEGIIELLTAKGALLGRKDIRTSVPVLLALKDADHLPRGAAVLYQRVDDIRPTALAGNRQSAMAAKLGPQPHLWHRGIAAGLVHQPPAHLGRAVACVLQPDGEIAMMPKSSPRWPISSVETHGTNLWFEKDDQFWSDLRRRPACGFTRAARTRSMCGSTPAAPVWPCSTATPNSIARRIMYIEATDQHRGWFQSSLMMSSVARGKARRIRP